MKIENFKQLNVTGFSHVSIDFNFSYQVSHLISPLIGVNRAG